GNAEGFFERSCKVRCRDATDVCEPLDWPILFRGGVHAVLRAQQAAQQCRVLASHRDVPIARFRGVGDESSVPLGLRHGVPGSRTGICERLTGLFGADVALECVRLRAYSCPLIRTGQGMWILVSGLALFFLVHFIPTFPDVRARLVGMIGRGPYAGLFSLV